MTRYLLGAVVRLYQRVCKGGIDKWERGRARSEAAAAAPLHKPLTPAEQQHVEQFHAFAEDVRSGEFPILDDPLQASPLDTYWRLPAVAVEGCPLFDEVAARLLEPAPLPALDFTGSWRAIDVAAMVERAKADAR